MGSQLPESDDSFISGQHPNFAGSLTDSDRSFHAYVHIPFCRVRCGYCDFNTYTALELRGASQANFPEVLSREFLFAKKQLEIQKYGQSRRLKSIFFGGGTPTQLSAETLSNLLISLSTVFGIEPEAEITTEANPDNVTSEYLKVLRQAGFTRVSFGMQSAVPEVLATLERTHNPANVALAVESAKAASLQTSVDLIYGAPNETLEQWQQSLNQAIALEPDHVSAYSLIVEPGTKLAKQIERGELPEPDEDLQAQKYEMAESMLSQAGYQWYEVSNWSKSKETRSAHNMAYWSSQDWWGFGPGAHSHIGDSRWWNSKHPANYQKLIDSDNSPAVGAERIDAETRLTERILLEARVVTGISIDLAKTANPNYRAVVSELIANGLVDGKLAIQNRLVLTLKGRLLADHVVRELLG